jgi:hypothetical protein
MELLNTCKNMTEANKYISRLLKTFNINEIIENSILIGLLKYHPTKNIDIENIEYIKLKLREPFYKPAVYFKIKNRNEDDISWKMCIRNLYKKFNKTDEHIRIIKTAFRTESHWGTKRQYRCNNNGNICCNCEKTTDDIQTDHYPIPYKKIFNDFIEEHNISLSNIYFYENEYNEIRLKDKELATKWLKHHDTKAQYRLLCRACNSRFGAYGY